jgi:antitoxin (DNA-binding transcriptional repressor) of toxin-antitoxin stability system
MKAVDVKQLKARLSEYLRLVKTSETVLITDRDEVVAELRSARRQSAGGLSVEEQLQALADAGETTRPSLPKGNWTWKVRGLGLPPGTVTRLLDEVRGDRI